MKNNQRFTLALAAAAVALGAYMLFVESKQAPPSADANEVTVWSLTENQAKDLDTLEVAAAGKTASYKRDEKGDWRLAAEPKRDLDVAFKSAYDNLKELKAFREVEAKPADLGKYGLKAPQVTLTWGKPEAGYVLKLGDKNPDGSGQYLWAAKTEKVYTVASYKGDTWKTLATDPPLVPLPSPIPSPSPVPSPSPAASPAPASPAAGASPAH